MIIHMSGATEAREEPVWPTPPLAIWPAGQHPACEHHAGMQHARAGQDGSCR
jgi:hypothetical protein